MVEGKMPEISTEARLGMAVGCNNRLEHSCEEIRVKGKLPTIAGLMPTTLELLANGPHSSKSIRSILATKFGLSSSDAEWKSFVNRHAWALVRLQQSKLIRKVAPGTYEMDGAGLGTFPSPQESHSIFPMQPLPIWARSMISVANGRNAKRWSGEKFSEGDLRNLWNQCKGRCAITGLPFLENRIGTGKAKRAHAPSLDRINPELPYTLENCRLVRTNVNFALNSWGDDVFDEMVRAAAAHRR